jgi:hypothetical protein
MATTFWKHFAWHRRMASAAGLAFFSLAATMTMKLARAEWNFSRADGEPTSESLREAVAINPRDSSAWIALGLAAEGEHDFPRAAQYLAEAEKVDRRYLPAWTSANFYFRGKNAREFWDAAARAAAMIYDDPRPLIDLADRMEPDPAMALDRLHGAPSVERAYLDFLIGKRRWKAGQTVALRILARRDPSDADRLQDFADRLTQAGQREAALSLSREMRNFHDRL